jgi:hypothetical protein
MQVESVSYVFGQSELCALLTILDCPNIPFSSLSGNIEKGMESLESALLVSQSGEQYIVDKIAAFLVKSVAESERYICVFDAETYVGLFHHALATIVLRRDKETWIFTPFQKLDEGVNMLEEIAAAYALPKTIAVHNKKGLWQCKPSDKNSAKQRLKQAEDWAKSDDVPSGEDVTQWKP